MRLNFDFRPRTVGQNIAYYAFCLLLASPCWYSSGVFGRVMTGVDAAIVLVAAGVVLGGCGSCRG